MNQQGFVNKLLIVLVVVIVGVMGYFVLDNKLPLAEPTPPVGEKPPITTPILAQPTDVLPQPISNTSPLSVSPTSGSAPLAVIFTSIVGDPTSQPASWRDGVDTDLDFGDNTQFAWMQCPGSDAKHHQIIKSQVDEIEKPGFIGFRCPVQVQHTYYKAGTYTAKLIRAGGFCPEPGCGTTNLGTVIITAK